MSSVNLKKLVNRHPREAVTVERLVTLLKTPTSFGKEFTLDRLSNLLKPTSREELALILAELVRAGCLRFIVRVEFPSSGGGIKDFDDLEEVPARIYDWRTDRELEVTSENLRVLYKFEKPSM